MKKRIGIVGGGQLGRMLAQAAQKMGYFVTVLDPGENSPAGQVADAQILGSFKDKDMVLELAKVSDFMTFEIESANAEALEEIEKTGLPVHPSPALLKIIKDKYSQKVFLRERNIPVGKFASVENEADCENQAEIFGYPFLLKARFDAYDGRGNFVVKNQEDIKVGFEKLAKSKLYAEKFVPFIKELSVVCARGVNGEIITYPVVETIHKNNICHIVRSPAPVGEDIILKARRVANQVLDNLKGVGTIAVEMFLTDSGDVLVNEIAPRVHNSGHHTIEAFDISQFEAHIQAVTGMDLQEPKPLSQTAVMINILGERNGEALLSGEHNLNLPTKTHVHIYGKIETRPERKMGHITVLSNDLESAENLALEIRKNLEI
jgi:5-(carboxyamino)imidazole ribonucleotide synthase